MPPPSPPDSAAGGKRLGRYLLERRIASGGMADVYLATQIGEFGFRKSVALKVLKSEVSSDDDNVRMFLREALVAAEFHHPNLVQVYEVDREAGELFLAMELVRGISAATLMLLLAKKGRAIPTPLAVRIAREVLEGLAYAHEARGPDGAPLDVVHRLGGSSRSKAGRSGKAPETRGRAQPVWRRQRRACQRRPRWRG